MDAKTLQRAMPGLPASRAQALVGPCNAAMIHGKITTRRRAAYFLAQVGHESVSLRYQAEIGGSHTRYAPYYGRSFIQVTWESNYRAFGQWLGMGEHFVKHPAALEQDRYAWLGAVWYWTTQRSCNALCDEGDFIGLTRAINGGTNGLADRQSRLRICEALGDAILPDRPDVLTKDERYHVNLLRKKGVSKARRARAIHWLGTRARRIQQGARGQLKGQRKGWTIRERSARFQAIRKLLRKAKR